MAGAAMKGFTLIEVLVALCVIMVFFVGISKLSVLAVRSTTYAEDLTCAATLGHTKLLELKAVSVDSPSMSLEWHQDPGNPLISLNREFYRFWQVDKVPMGREVRVYVAWKDTSKGVVRDFASVSALMNAGCPRTACADVFLQE